MWDRANILNADWTDQTDLTDLNLQGFFFSWCFVWLVVRFFLSVLSVCSVV